MRKLIVLISIVVLLYVVFDRKKYESKIVQASEVEEIAEFENQNNKPTGSLTNTAAENKNSAAATAIITPSKGHQLESSKNSVIAETEKKELAPYGITDDRQISDIDTSYTPPDFLKGTSAIVAEYIHVSEVLKNAAISDIQSTFDRGLPLSKFISEGLKVPGKYNIVVHFDDWQRKTLEGELYLTVSYATLPLQGQLSLKLAVGEDKVEKSCDAMKVGPLKRLKMLPEENSVLLFGACDKSFYLQLYYNGTHTFRGNYYERIDSRYIRTGEALVVTKFDD